MSLTLEGVVKKVGSETHIYGIDLTLEPGSLNILLGPTLSGKTTLMRLMAGLDRPSPGRVFVDGKDVTGHSVRKRNVAMVYQEFVNYPSFTVYENIATPLKRAGVDKAQIDRRVRETAEMLHIDPLLKRQPAELSGGQQQRTALARALVKEADLLLLDEPLVNLDYKLREELRTELREIFNRRQTIVVYATTEPSEALLLEGTVFILDEGRLLQTGPTAQVYRNPDSVRVGTIFSDPPMNILEGSIENNEVRILKDTVFPLASHMEGLDPGPYRFGVRAHQFSLTLGSDSDVEIKAAVELGEISGSETYIHMSKNGTSWVVVELGVHTFRLGEIIHIFVDPKSFFVYDPSGTLIRSPYAKSAQRNSIDRTSHGAR
ncbi:MAG: ABC transporter ATP-binding protein [bacterium]